MTARRTARRTATVIEGEAIVIDRRPGSPRSPAETDTEPPAVPINDNRPFPFPATWHRLAPQTDLVFQGRAAGSRLRTAPAASMEPLRAGRRAYFMAVLLAFAAAAGCGIAWTAAGAPASAVAAVPRAGFELSEVRTAIARRGGGYALLVEGRVRNVSATAEVVPPVRVRLGGADGAALVRDYRPAAGSLAPGAAITFHSTLALASATTGHVSVALQGGAPEGKRIAE